MSGPFESITQFLIQRVVEETRDRRIMNNPTVLSCGGMYLPRPKFNFQNSILSYDVLSLANSDKPVKVVTGSHPVNALHQILFKESMN